MRAYRKAIHWSEELVKASLRKSHANGDMEDEKLIAERETICKGLLSGGNISSLRD
jgi:hypothetical protein